MTARCASATNPIAPGTSSVILASPDLTHGSRSQLAATRRTQQSMSRERFGRAGTLPCATPRSRDSHRTRQTGFSHSHAESATGVPTQDVLHVGHSRREPRLRGCSSIGVRRAGSARSLRPWRGPLSTTLFLMSMTGEQVPGVASNIVLARAGSTRSGSPSGSCVSTLSICERR